MREAHRSDVFFVDIHHASAASIAMAPSHRCSSRSNSVSMARARI
ncbi:hypothetical protein NK6_3550 [Bradyrhizobium diazoefficiens]|uniref:Uncharacterized protein n=1 Tax=Bradyrhizobium diazoefficiens TaxID=1355477 RepID=A0A0E4BNJ3_9BRAD|nr:hypothetical protein NK6_3550 [Bradyrhizobium diazoefficiens]